MEENPLPAMEFFSLQPKGRSAPQPKPTHTITPPERTHKKAREDDASNSEKSDEEEIDDNESEKDTEKDAGKAKSDEEPERDNQLDNAKSPPATSTESTGGP